MSLNKQIRLTFIALICVFIFFEYTNMDTYIQEFFFKRSTNDWIVGKDNILLNYVFYKGPNIFFGAFAVICLFVILLSIKIVRLKDYRKKIFLIMLSLILIPLTMSTGKKISNTYCPSQLSLYNGTYPYVKLCKKYPDYFIQKKKGNCFPAGHASGGFALMCLYFVFERNIYKYAGLLTGFSIGWIIGIYQMIRGKHFLSHTMVTMFLGWLIILIIYKALYKRNRVN